MIFYIYLILWIKQEIEMSKDKMLNVKDNYVNLFIRIHKDKKKELREKAKKNGKTLSVVLRDLIDEYISK